VFSGRLRLIAGNNPGEHQISEIRQHKFPHSALDFLLWNSKSLKCVSSKEKARFFLST
jgi:hypothetical protein